MTSLIEQIDDLIETFVESSGSIDEVGNFADELKKLIQEDRERIANIIIENGWTLSGGNMKVITTEYCAALVKGEAEE